MTQPPRTVLEPAAPGDEPALRRLLRETPMRGAIALTLEREPDFGHAAGIEGDRHHVLVGRRAGRVVGYASRSVRAVFVDGAPARVGYLGGLRVAPEARDDIRRLREGFARMHATRAPEELPFDLTSVVADNLPARRLFEAGLRGFPVYAPLGELVTLVLAPRRARRAPPVTRGAPERLPELAAFLLREGARHQLAPRMDEDVLRSPSRLRGLSPEDFLLVEARGGLRAAGAIWDQRAFKQTVVRRYAPALRLVRPLLAPLGRVLGLGPLPREHVPLACAYLAFAFAAGDDPDAFGALLDAALDEAARRGLEALLLGLAADHPLLRVARRERHRALRSVLYAAHFADGAARVAALDRRLLAPEVAIL